MGLSTDSRSGLEDFPILYVRKGIPVEVKSNKRTTHTHLPCRDTDCVSSRKLFKTFVFTLKTEPRVQTCSAEKSSYRCGLQCPSCLPDRILRSRSSLNRQNGDFSKRFLFIKFKTFSLGVLLFCPPLLVKTDGRRIETAWSVFHCTRKPYHVTSFRDTMDVGRCL